MKLALSVAIALCLIGTAVAGTNSVGVGKIRLADAAADACFANCSNQAESCRRVCPTTLSTPCLNTCDSQAQTCRLSCQRR